MTHARIPFENGALSPDELAAAFAGLPADITFVDAAGIVRYYSAYRIFSRSPACLDQDVLACHSEGSRPGIARLLSELASGWRDEAIFVEKKDERDVSVRYLAVRDSEGSYLGCLEVAQWADEVPGGAGF
jgi:DUF438 domain-containing protein